MALTTFLTSLIPGVSNVLSQVDSMKAQFLAVPQTINTALDRLAAVRQAMARNGAPLSAQSDAMQVEQHLRDVRTQWDAAASSLQRVEQARAASGTLSLDTLTAAGTLVASMSYVLANRNTLLSSVDALAAKYLTAQQQTQIRQGVSTAGLMGGASSLLPVLAVGVLAFMLIRRR